MTGRSITPYPLTVFLSAIAACVVAVVVLSAAPVKGAGTLEDGFSQERLVDGLDSPTAMSFAPDGRLFVTEQGGAVRVIKDGKLLPEPFLKLPASAVDSEGERGLLGIAFDPGFENGRPYVYVYYTLAGNSNRAPRNRVVRFTARGDQFVPGSYKTIFLLEALGAKNHNGGAIHFGKDNKLYVAVGDNAKSDSAQSLKSLNGKMLRINSTGSIPGDNPFYKKTRGKDRAIWARGFRNPFSFAVKPGSGAIFVNDVGLRTWEEIDYLRKGLNYGWPRYEGPSTTRGYAPPSYAYRNQEPSPCAITGGTFYNPENPQFPSKYVGDYFFADFCGGWIRYRDIASHEVKELKGASGERPVDLKVDEDGALYYLARETGSVEKIIYDPTPAP